MPLPAQLETAAVTGTWQSPAGGGPLVGTATLVPLNAAVSPAGDVLLTTSPGKVTLVNGAASWTGVLLTDSDNLSNRVPYRLIVKGDGYYEDRVIELLKAAVVEIDDVDTIKLSTVATAEPSPALVSYLLAVLRGVANGVASLGPDGTVPPEQLPAGGGGGVASVAAGDATIVIGGTATAPTVRVGAVPQSAVTNLVNDLAGKAATAHTHTASNVTDFQTAVDARVQLIVGAAPAALDTLVELAAALGADPNFAGTVTTALAARALATRLVSAGTGLTGGGDLTADRTLAVAYGTSAGTAAQGNDSRLSDARTPLPHAHVIGDTTGLQAALDGKAPLAHSHTLELLFSAYGGRSGTGHVLSFESAATPGQADHLIFLCPVRPGETITGIKVGNGAAATYAATGTPAQARMYDFDGALLGTSPDDPALWGTIGMRSCTFAAPFVAPSNGLAFIGLSFGGFSGVSLPSGPVLNGSLLSGLVGGKRLGIFANSGAGLPSSFNPATYGIGATDWIPYVVVLSSPS